MIDRREFLPSVAAGVAVTTTPLAAHTEPPQAAATQASSQPPRPAAGLAAPAFQPLPLGAIRPRGWLQRQLRLQADGLSGHLDEFWPDVSQSQWFGGTAEGWERAPYWLDGAIPLAWLLDDQPLKARISRSSPTVAPTSASPNSRGCGRHRMVLFGNIVSLSRGGIR